MLKVYFLRVSNWFTDGTPDSLEISSEPIRKHKKYLNKLKRREDLDNCVQRGNNLEVFEDEYGVYRGIIV